MAPRVFLLCVCFTVGLFTYRSLGVSGLDLGLELTSEPEDVIVTRSKSCTLECSAVSSSGAVSISWIHNGQPLNLVNDSRRFLLQNGSLFIKKVVTKKIGPNDGPDQGEYRCIATAANSVLALVSRPAHLRVANLSHEFTEFPTNQTAEEGSTIRFACQIDSIPNSLITWEKDQKSLPQSSRFILLNSGVLFISASQPMDAGAYRCVATNPLTKKQRSSVEGQLTIVSRSSNLSPPTFLSTQTSLQTISGNNLTLVCSATGWPLPKLTWIHKSQPLNKTVSFENPNKTVNIPGLNILSIDNVKTEHSGNYTCSTLNGQDVVSQTVDVTVLVPPTFKSRPLSQVYPTAKTVRFECEARGIPTPEIKWYKDGAPLKINGRIKQRATELLLSNTVTDDSGLYQCVAKNMVGETWVAGRLLVNASQYQPEPPHGLRCQAKSATQVELTWQEPDSRQLENNIKAYTVHHLPTAGGEEGQEVSLNRSVVVEKLMAYTNYTFYARAYSGRSASDQSERVICQTGEEVPLSAPLVSAEPTSHTTLRVWWKPVPVERARGLITEYKIQWRRSGHPSSNVDQVKGDVLDYTITGLHSSEEYEVRVLAATSQGWPEIPDDQLSWTKLTMPTDNASNTTPTPPIVHLIVVNATSIQVNWRLPLDDSYKPSKYHLYYRKVNSKQIGPIILKPSTTQYLLTNLDPGTKFEVHVAGWQEETGEGSRGVKWIYTLPGQNQIQEASNLLEPPTMLDAEPTGMSSINLTWNPPLAPNNASYYEVCYNPVGSQDQLSYIRSTSHGVEITKLKTFTQYEFKVRSHDLQNRHGPYSRGVECSTLGGLPGPVKDVHWQVLNTSTIRIGWKSPEKSNGVISAYLVTLSSDLTMPLDEWKTQRTSGSRFSMDISELSSNVRYYLTVRAESRMGLGAPSITHTLTIPSVLKTPPTDPVVPPEEGGGQHLGMVVVVIIGLVCVVICALALVIRRRCTKSSVPEVGAPANGNGCCRERRMLGVRDAHELELLADTSAHIQPVHIPPSNHAHLDTKGGGGYPNGQANGLANGRMPNGHAARDRGNVHITENPQYARRQEHRTPLLDTHTPGAGGGCNDSSNASNWTQITALDCSTNSGIDLKPPQ